MTKKILTLAVALMLLPPCFAQQKKTTNSQKPKTEAKKAAKKADAKAAKSKADTHEAKAEKEDLLKIYDEERDPMELMEMGLEEARNTGRTAILQLGGNWCPWCLRLSALVHQNDSLAPLVNEQFVYIHINVPKERERRNIDLLKRLGNPGRFGYPVLVVMSDEGYPIQTQRTDIFEKGKSYDVAKLQEFFLQWSRKARENIE